MKKDGYLFSLDVIRAFAILCVLSVHFLFNTSFYKEFIGNYYWSVYFVFRALFIVGVPLFIMLSGFLLNKKEASVKFYKKLLYILGIYFLACCVTALGNTFILHETFSLKDFLYGIIEFKYIRYAWYVQMYLGLFLLVPFLNIMWQNLASKRQKIALIGTLFFVTILNTISNNPRIFPDYWMSAYPLTFYFIGAYMSEQKINISQKVLTCLICALVCGIGLINFAMCYGSTFPKIFFLTDSGGIEAAIVAVPVFVFLQNADYSCIPAFLKKCVSIIAKYAYGMYLCSFIADKILYGWINSHTVGLMTDKLIFWAPTVGVLVCVTLVLACFCEMLWGLVCARIFK